MTRRDRRLLLVAGGLGCLLLVAVLGLAAGPGANGPDRDLGRLLGQWLDERPYRRVVALLASESGWPHAAYALALLPVAVAGTLAVLQAARRERVDPARWRWLLLGLGAVPLQHLLRLGFERAGPRAPFEEAVGRGAFPSGAALLVALGWAAGLVVAGDLRPRWRPLTVAAAALALAVHALARVAAHKHWASDILGSYLLVAGVLLVAAGVAAPSRS